MTPHVNQKNFKIYVAAGYRWSYGDKDKETLASGIHDVNVDELPEHVTSKVLLDTVAASSGIHILNKDNSVLALTTDRQGKYLVRGIDICGACNGNGSTGEEGDYDKLTHHICELCGYNNENFDPGRPSDKELEDRKAAPETRGREPGEPKE
jgi:hypothetical protein